MNISDSLHTRARESSILREQPPPLPAIRRCFHCSYCGVFFVELQSQRGNKFCWDCRKKGRKYMTDLEKLQERVANGIEWLTAHDPTGAFHLWFSAKILPGTRKPAQPPEREIEYAAYYKARQQWEVMFAAMERQEARQ